MKHLKQPFKIIDEVGMPDVVAFVRQRLSALNIGSLESIRINAKMNRQHMGLEYCARELNGKIRIDVYPSGLDYPLPDRSGITFANPCELVVMVTGHEVFHYLRRIRAISGKNTEEQADAFGKKWLRCWRWQQRWKKIRALF